MINFFNEWIQQIAIAVIIVSIIELILPRGNLKKYIKIVLGIYVIFSIISPFVNKSDLYKIEDINIDIDNYINNTISKEKSINQTSMDKRIQGLYIEQLKNDIKMKVEEKGYGLDKCKIDADLIESSDNSGIHKIELTLNENKNITEIQKIEIGNREKESTEKEKNAIDEIKEIISAEYEIDKEIIEVKIK